MVSGQRFSDIVAAAALWLRLAFCAALIAAGAQTAFAQGGLPGVSGGGGETADQKAAAAKDLFGRDTPRGLASSLVAAFGASDYERAANYLEPVKIGREDGASLARMLQQQLDQGGSLLPFAALSKDPAGAVDDGLPVDQERIGSLKTRTGTVPLIARHIEGEAGKAPYWVVSAESLKVVAAEQRAPHPESKPALTDALPDALNETRVAGAPVADWLVLIGVGVAVFLGLWLVFALLLKGLHAIVRDPDSSASYRFAHAALPPFGLWVAVLVFFAAVNNLQVAIVARQQLVRYGGIVGWIALAWFLWRLTDAITTLWSGRMERAGRRRAMSALVFAQRAAKTLLVFVAIVLVLDTLGVDVTTGIAALGIGGIALALGAQKTIENLVGSVTVIADEPVRVGDFCKVGSVLGTVEDIGMRSTRIRTNERTVVTIPNGAFSSQQIENYSRRDRFLFSPTIRLAYDTDATLMRAVLDDIRAVLAADKNITNDARVRFVAISPDSLDVEIFAYIQTFDYGISLQMREQALLGIMDAISRRGARLALPTTQAVLVREPRPAS